MKLTRIHISKGFQVIALSVCVVIAIGFTERGYNGDVCQDIIIQIENQHDNYFIDQEDVLRLVTNNGQQLVKGASFDQLNLKEIEERVRQEYFIGNAELYKDLKGNLLVNVELQRPMARMVRNDGPHAYVAENGEILPVSDKFTARTLILSGSKVSELMKEPLYQSSDGEKLYTLLRFIYEDPFWKAQIAQIEIGKDMYLKLYPQVTKQVIEFGQPVNLDEKFRKLRIFYQKILPTKGWNAYDRVNVEYDKQIIAE